MSIQVALRHNTYYDYDRHITLSPHVIRLKPAPHSRTSIKSYSLRISPSNHFINWQQDPFGNYMARVVFPEKVNHLHVEVEVIADLVTINPFDFFLEEYAETFPFSYTDQLKKELAPYLEISEGGEKLQALYEKSKGFLDDGSINFLVNVNQLVYNAVSYTIRLEHGVQTCEQTLQLGTGSCRDSAWLLVQLMRRHGLAARFVSGYLVQLKPDQKSVDGPSGTSEDFTDLHAWAEVYLPGAGWVGLDATSGLLTGEGHIPLSCTPEPSSAAPISGLADPCETTFSFENVVERIYETPRVTKPFESSEWDDIISLGELIDKRLQEGDVRLSMGGEPTFVSAEDMESDQWNTAADGIEKRLKGYQLTQRLKKIYAPKGLIHQGQGKWYPGEPIPRWQYTLYWRKDGHRIWGDESLLCSPFDKPNYDVAAGRKFINGLASALGLNDNVVHPAYEDEYYFLWEQSKLPKADNPLEKKEKLSLERKKLEEILQRGSGKEVGFILPITYDVTEGNWKSCRWITNREKLFLIPGNSSIGYRLPLDSFPSESSDPEKTIIEPSPLDDHGSLATLDVIDISSNVIMARDNEVRTALCVEVREGRVYVFLPPMVSIDHFLELISFVEKAASDSGTRIILEGYQPPFDSRIHKLAITPDPGVLEINVHPATSWKEIVTNYQHLFEEARQCKLGAEKFMLDGRHTGTGGGNHITLGGASPADSPLLRRPDLLRSMLAFWHNHPSLSYLFSSAFIGPTSQAPRVDEGRRGSELELEIAFAQLDKIENPQPWIVDRIFRNILIDLTGNTHRAEFCIDKLYSPDSNTGRLGILELRGFDMPPNIQMCLVQILLIRSLVARFWKTPYKEPLQKWGNNLYDKYLLHHYVKEDMTQVVDYLREGGIPFEMSWLDSFFEFRFPLLGETKVEDIKLSLRSAIEPWNVLGEEMSSAGTARFVDSSVEKLEIVIDGIDTNRYALLCNQVMLPLQKANGKGSYVVGVRYKAWNPPSALHPTIPVDTPLTFDIYDLWNQRSIGGCTYHVAHPGGRSYDTFPINSLEAESRRMTRFVKEDHTPRKQIVAKHQDDAGVESSRWITTQQSGRALDPSKLISPTSALETFTVDLRKM